MDKALLKEFLVEVEENLQELEPNLLLLEGDRSDEALLNDCLRNLHSIKGASGYMGFQQMSKLSHGLESLFDRARQGKVTLHDDMIDLIFDGVDLIKKLSKEIEKEGKEKSDITGLISKLEKTSAGKVQEEFEPIETEEDIPLFEESEDDAELLELYVGEMKELFNELSKEVNKKDISLEKLKHLLSEMERVTHYIGYDKILSQLQTFLKELENLDPNTQNIHEIAKKIEESLGTLLEKEIGIPYSPTSQEMAPQDDVLLEDDEELYQIFLDHVLEVVQPLAHVPDTFSEKWAADSQEALEKFRISAKYMDYDNIVLIIDEWGERLAELLSLKDVEKHYDPQKFRELWNKIKEQLPGIEKAEQMEIKSVDSKKKEVTGKDEEKATEEDEYEAVLDDLLQGLEDKPAEKAVMQPEEPKPEKKKEAKKAEKEKSVEQAIEPQEEKAKEPEPEKQQEPVEEKSVKPPKAKKKKAKPETKPKKEDKPEIEPFIWHDPVFEQEAFMPHYEAKRPQKAGGPEDVVQQRPSPKPLQDKKGTDISSTVRIDLSNVDELLANVGELVVLRSSVTHLYEDLKSLYRNLQDKKLLNLNELKPFKFLITRMGEQIIGLERTVNELQESVMAMRMLPVRQLFDRYPRMVRDLAKKLGKKVKLNIYGQETRLDKRLMEEIADPLMHIIRNAMDHGIETPEERKKAGKPVTGNIDIMAYQEGNFVVISIKDDGKGLDKDALLKSAVKQGIIDEQTAKTMPAERVWSLIFMPGISTADTVSETSGRGVGMDVVRHNIEKIGGTIHIYSEPGKGTQIQLRIPLTLAIIPALLVQVGSQKLAIPLNSVQEAIRVDDSEISSVEGFEIISLRQATLPIIRLSKVFRGPYTSSDKEKVFVVVVKHGNLEAGLVVDSLLGQQDVVIKPLADYLTDQPGFAGASVLGDGSIALIIDIVAVMQRAKAFVARQRKLMEEMAAQEELNPNMTIH